MTKMTKYAKFFLDTLKKFGVKSPADLSYNEKIEFFNYIVDNWESEKSTKMNESKHDLYRQFIRKTL